MPEPIFWALAAGGGGERACEVLTAAERSKHLLLLSTLDAAVRGAADPAGGRPSGSPGCPDRRYDSSNGQYGSWDQVYSLLAAAQRAAPAAVEPLLRYPAVGAWALHALRDLRTGRTGTAPVIEGLAAVAAAASIRARTPARIELAVSDGALMLPSLGRVLLPGARTAIVGVDGGVREVVADNGLRVVIPAQPHADGSGWEGLRRITAGTPGREVELLIDDLDPYRMPGAGNLAGRLSGSQWRHWQTQLEKAWELLTRQHWTTAAEVRKMIRVLTPLTARSGGQLGATSRETFGNIALSAPADALIFAVALAHEVQHSKLCGLQDILPFGSLDSGRRHYVPWRDDPRPLGAVLQGTYAFLGVAGFWRRQRHVETGPAAHHATVEFARWLTAVRRSVRTLEQSDELTPVGLRFTSGIRRTITAWAQEPVPERARAQAREALDGHRRRWAKRNVRGGAHG